MFATVYPSLIFESKAGSSPSKSRLLYLPKNIRVEWMWLTLTNTLAYYDTDNITPVIFLYMALGHIPTGILQA